MKNVFLVGLFCVCGSLSAEAIDGEWIPTNGGSYSWTNAAYWVNGIIPGDGGSALLRGFGSYSTLIANATATLSQMTFNLSEEGAVSSFVFTSGTITLVPPALIQADLHANSRVEFQPNACLKSTGDITVTGKSYLTPSLRSEIQGRVIISNGWMRILDDAALGVYPATLDADAIILDNGTLQNGRKSPASSIQTNRGITVTAQGGAFIAGYNENDSSLQIFSPITGEGDVTIGHEFSPVQFFNPANDYAGDTIVGGPCIGANRDNGAKLYLRADEVIPHGTGKGILSLFPFAEFYNENAYNGIFLREPSGAFDLYGHTETVNAVQTGTRSNINSSNGRGRLILASDQDSSIRGAVQNSVTIGKAGAGTLDLVGCQFDGTLDLTAGTALIGASNPRRGSVFRLAGGALILDAALGLNEYLITGITTQYLRRVDHPRAIHHNVYGTQIGKTFLYKTHWNLPQANTFSFKKFYPGGVELHIDGNLIYKETTPGAGATVTNVTLNAGTHLVEFTFTPFDNVAEGRFNGLYFDRENGEFDSDACFTRMRQFANEVTNKEFFATCHAPEALEAVIALPADAQFRVTENSSLAYLAGGVYSEGESPSTLSLTMENGVDTLFIGSTSAGSPAIAGANISGVNVVYTNHVLFTMPIPSDAVIASNAMLTLDFPGAFDTPTTLTDHSLRIASSMSSDQPIRVLTGQTLRIDTSMLTSDLQFADLSSNVIEVSVPVILEGGTLDFIGEGDIQFHGNLSGTGTIRKYGTGAVTLTGTNSLTDTSFRVLKGTLILPNEEALGGADLWLNGGAVQNLSGSDLSFQTTSIKAEGGGIFATSNQTISVLTKINCVAPISKWGPGDLIIGGEGSNDNLLLHAREGTLFLAKEEGRAALMRLIGLEAGSTVVLSGSSTNQIAEAAHGSGGTFDLNGHSIALDRIVFSNETSTIVNNGSTPVTLSMTGNQDSILSKTQVKDGLSPLTICLEGSGKLLADFANLSNSGGILIRKGTFVPSPSNRLKTSLLRFTIQKMRPDGEHFGSGYQLSELRFYDQENLITLPEGTTAIALGTTGSSEKEGVAKLISGSTSDKFYCPNKIPFLIAFGTPTTVSRYQWATANDATGRDPIDWIVESGFVIDSITNWTTISTVTNFPTTTARNSWQSPLSINKQYASIDANYPIVLEKMGAIQLIDITQSFMNITGDGTISLSNADVTLLDGVSFTGKVNGRGIINCSFTENTIPAFSVESSTVRVENGSPVAAQFTFENDTDALFSGILTDKTEPFGLTVTNQANVLLTSVSNDYSGPTVLSGGTTTIGGSNYGIKVIRLTFTKTRAGLTSDCQLNEFEILNNGEKISWPAGTVASLEYGQVNNKAEGPDKLIDGIATVWGSKLYMSTQIIPILITMPEPISFDGYRWYTANDMPSRDGVSWKLEASRNGIDWQLLDVQEDATITSNRYSIAFTGTFPVTERNAISDQSTVTLTAPGILRLSSSVETIPGVNGNGQIECELGSILTIAPKEGEDQFNGAILGTGTVSIAGTGTQILSGRLAYSGDLIVESGTLDLTGASLEGVTNIILRGGTLIGNAKVLGDLHVQFEGGVYGAELFVQGKLTLSGTPTLLVDANGNIRRTCFSYTLTDEESKTLFREAIASQSIPSGQIFSARVTDNAMTLSVQPGGTIILLK